VPDLDVDWPTCGWEFSADEEGWVIDAGALKGVLGPGEKSGNRREAVGSIRPLQWRSRPVASCEAEQVA
jgi:hypothetical protein